jgi:putative transposase
MIGYAGGMSEREWELSEEQWGRIKPLLPPVNQMGRPRADDQKVLHGILYVLRTGCRWKDMPREYGAPVTAWRRLRSWQREGVWERIWQALLQCLDEEGRLEWTRAFLDGSFVSAKKGERRSV